MSVFVPLSSQQYNLAGTILPIALGVYLTFSAGWTNQESSIPKRRTPCQFKQTDEAFKHHDYARAEAEWRSDLAIELKLSPDPSADIEIWCIEVQLSRCLLAQHKYGGIERLLTDAVAISRKIRNPKYQVVRMTLADLAIFYHLTGRESEAEQLLAEVFSGPHLSKEESLERGRSMLAENYPLEKKPLPPLSR